MEHERNAHSRSEASYLPANAAQKVIFCPGRHCCHCGRPAKRNSLRCYGLGVRKPPGEVPPMHRDGPAAIMMSSITWLDGAFCSIGCAREVHPALRMP